jgi:hypothetical protein
MVISNLGAKPLVLQVPIGSEDAFKVSFPASNRHSAVLSCKTQAADVVWQFCS